MVYLSREFYLDLVGEARGSGYTFEFTELDLNSTVMGFPVFVVDRHPGAFREHPRYRVFVEGEQR